MNMDFYNSDFRYHGYGLHIKKPIEQFLVGLGLIKQEFSEHSFYLSNGKYTAPEGGQGEKFGYVYEIQNINFLALPLYVNYRLPCNCVYIQGRMLVNFRKIDQIISDRETFLLQESQNNIYSVTDIKSFSLGYELAFGMNMHISISLKMIGKLSYI